MFEFLNAGSNGENVILYDNQDSSNLKGSRTREVAPYESFLMTVIRLRGNFSINHLAFLFEVIEFTISNTFTTWINFMFVRLGSISIWPSKQQVWELMPQSMKEIFPNCRCIIDCVEFEVKLPSLLFLYKMQYSDYKSHTTAKVLVGTISIIFMRSLQFRNMAH